MSAPLLSSDFSYLTGNSLESVAPEEWDVIQRQRHVFHRRLAADQLIAMLKVGIELPTYGYRLNNYEHCLQTATMMAEAGYDTEDVVVGLLHDIAFVPSPAEHGTVAAFLLGEAVSDRNRWMLEHHATVGEQFLPHDPGRWRDLRSHRWFAWTEEFVERFDLRAIDPTLPIAPIEDFEAAVNSVLGDPDVSSLSGSEGTPAVYDDREPHE